MSAIRQLNPYKFLEKNFGAELACVVNVRSRQQNTVDMRLPAPSSS